MIVEAIIGALVGIVAALVATLPQAGDLDLMGFGEAIAAFKAFDAGLPVTETLVMGAMCLAVIGGIFVTRLFLTIWHAIPGKMS